MGAWYIGTVWARGTLDVRDSGVVGNCAWNLLRASNVKGFDAVGASGFAIRDVVIGAARVELRR